MDGKKWSERGSFESIENPTFEQALDAIKNAVYGIDVRKAIAVAFDMAFENYNDDKIGSLSEALDSQKAELEKLIKSEYKILEERISRITLGIDEPTIDKIVTKILTEKGVI